MKRILVIDTSVFVNPASGQAFGNSPTSALTGFLELLSSHPDIDVVMPPSIYSELMYFVEQPKILPSLLIRVKQQPPKKHELKVPGFFIYVVWSRVFEIALTEVSAWRNVTFAKRWLHHAPFFVTKKSAIPTSVREDVKQISTLRESLSSDDAEEHARFQGRCGFIADCLRARRDIGFRR